LVKTNIALFGVASIALFLAGPARAQTPAKISIVQGDGQVLCDGCANSLLPAFDPLVVLVTDANNNPVPNATVTWTVISAVVQPSGAASVPGSFSAATTITGSATGSSAALCNLASSSGPEAIGQTCNLFNKGSSASYLTGFIVNTVTASIANGQSVTFYLTQSPFFVANAPNGNYYYINAQLTADSIQPGATLSGTAGSPYGASIKVQVKTLGLLPVANVSIRLVPESLNQGGASISCQTTGSNADPGSVLTDSTGTAICTPVFGSTPGSIPQNFDLIVGGVASLQNPANAMGPNQLGQPAGFQSFGPFKATAVAPTPGSLVYVSGNSQAAQAGSAIPSPLVVEVNDTNGNPLPGVTVNWSVSPAGSAALSPAVSTTGANGQASTSVTLASSANGAVTVTASVSGLSSTVAFTLSATQPLPAITQLSIVSGNNQSAQTGAPFSAPLVVQVTPAQSGVMINFALGAGSVPATLSAPSAVTQAGGQASIAVTAGATAGTVTVVATVAGFTQTFTLTVTSPPPPPPAITSINFLNGAGFFPTSSANQAALSPCAIGTLVVGASPLAPSALPAVPNMYTAPLQQSTGIKIAFPSPAGTTNAPLLNVGAASTGQQLIAFQVPCDATVSAGESVAVTVNGATTNVTGVVVRDSGPGIFETVSSDGVRRALAVRANGSFVDPANPAHAGDFVTVYVTGLGLTVPPLTTGAGAVLPQPGINTIPANPVIVTVNNVPTGAVTVTASPDLIGVFQVTFQIPANTAPGDNFLAVGSLVGQNPLQFQGGSKLYVQ